MVWICKPLPPAPKTKPKPRSMAGICKDKRPRGRLPKSTQPAVTQEEWSAATERESSIRALAAQIPSEWSQRQRGQAQIAHKIVTKLQVPHGPGETTGTQHHFVEVENINLESVKQIFAGIPISTANISRAGPNRVSTRYNWAATLEHVRRLEEILDLGCTRLANNKGEGLAVMRVGGEALVSLAPPFLVEHVDNGQETCKLTISFSSVVLNSSCAITWPPRSLWGSQDEYGQARPTPPPPRPQ